VPQLLTKELLMNGETTYFGLTGRDEDSPAPVLCGVDASGRLDGVLFELTLRQTYRNTSERALEVVYTFPLPAQAVLLGFACELNGESKVGTIVAKRTAEREYEQALAEGDAPVMLEALAGGLHSANIGNLKPGDELVLELRFAQVLAFEQGRLRVAIPTTIAPRYGNAESAGLQAQQVPQVSMLAEYPLALSVTISGNLARGHVECPTHRFEQELVSSGLRLQLAAGAWMDRDVVIVVTPREQMPSLLVQARDTVAQAAPVVLMAALQPPPAPRRASVTLKLLVDCSGSMAGDSMKSARRALHGALQQLTERDRVSLSRFGSMVEHVQAVTRCTPQVLRQLAAAVDAAQADLGGTEMERAVRAVFQLQVPMDTAVADLLLVTDGEIWQANAVIAAALASGHRVFAIGVGSSPAEGVLRSLAEATGGACEFATPGEALEAAAARMMVRIRQQPWAEVRIDWGCEPHWQTSLPRSVFGGDTVIAFAGVPEPTAAPAVRLLALDDKGASVEVTRGEADAPCPGDAVPRIAAARRLATADAAQASTLAVAYQLMSRHTNCILVHERAEADKVRAPAELQPVPSMLAAGWGTATVLMKRSASRSETMYLSATELPVMLRCAGMMASQAGPASYGDIAIPAFVRKRADDAPPATLKAIVQAVSEHLTQRSEIEGLAMKCLSLELHADVRAAIVQAVELGLSTDVAWLMLAHWASARQADVADTALADAMQAHVQGGDRALVARCMELFDRVLGDYEFDDWTARRATRLRQALGRKTA
jgi:Ca-activated chloride channel family protein